MKKLGEIYRMDSLRLRKATIADGEFAYQARKAAFRGYVDQVQGWDEESQRQLHERRFSSSQNYYVIQVSGIDVGILSTTHEPDCLKLNQLFILPAYQGQGIGRACVKLVIEDAEALQLSIRLKVLKVNGRALTFYQRLGFNRLDESETHVMMERTTTLAMHG